MLGAAFTSTPRRERRDFLLDMQPSTAVAVVLAEADERRVEKKRHLLVGSWVKGLQLAEPTPRRFRLAGSEGLAEVRPEREVLGEIE